MAKNFIWHKIAETIEDIAFSAAGIVQVTVAGKAVCLVSVGDALYACTATCPHAGGIMADGYTDALGNIVCPLHRYRFSPANGRNTSGEGYFLKNFPVEIRHDGVYIGFEESNFFNWLK